MSNIILAGENAALNPAILSVGRKNLRLLPEPPRTNLDSPDSNGGQSSGATLTGKGEAYAHAHEATCRGQPIPLTRSAIEAEIERLIELLDAADGDPDLEPYLAGFDSAPTDEREGGDVLDEPHDPDEGYDRSWPERGPQALGAECREDDEDDGADEPSLGWTGRTDQRFIAGEHDLGDREEQNEDGDAGEDGPSWRETVDQTILQVHL